MAKETVMEKDYLQNETIHTIYFGGGTPSLMDAGDIGLLLQTIRENYVVAGDAEITLEANPDDIKAGKLMAWKDLGINRLSIGVQSFFEEELRWMNRAHTASQAFDNLKLAKKHFDNITIDLIYGSPLLTDEMWKENVDRALSLNIPHLSCYALTVEEKTPLHKSIRNRRSVDVDPEKQARQFMLLMQWLREADYDHYEVSNFAQPGKRSRHNSSYWKGEKYLGIGPSAHSYNGIERRWNMANNNAYIKHINDGLVASEKEILSPQQRLNEYIMISLRTMEGMDLEKIENEWGQQKRKSIEKTLEKFLNSNMVRFHTHLVQLTDEGMLRADGIASELFG